MEQTFKPGDIVRLTAPLSNGQIVRIENVDEHGFASWLGGSQNCDMEQIEIKVEEEGNPFTDDLREYTVTLSDRVQEIESDFGVKLYPESAVEYWKRRAEIAEGSLAKLKDYIRKVCKENSDDIQKLDTENKNLSNHIEVLNGKIEKLELDKHSAEQVASVLLADLNKKDAENKELRERNEALKRQLDESNKQIEIHAKRERELEKKGWLSKHPKACTLKTNNYGD